MKNLVKQLPTPSLSGDCSETKRQEIKCYFQNTWQTYQALFALINVNEAFYLRPEPLRHPLIFYFGHTATFFINKLLLGKFIGNRLDEKLEAICAVGVDEMSWDDLDSSHYDWPSVDEVTAYRGRVYQLVNQLIDEMPLTLPIQQDSLAWVILMGCEHERIHLETSSVIMRMLPIHFLTANDSWKTCPYVDDAPENELLSVAKQQQILGKKVHDKTFGWDNEYGELKVKVNAFKVSKYLVSNQEFLAFVEAGGYQQLSYWSVEGRQWLHYKKVTMPGFWLREDGQYFQRNLLNIMPLPLNWPVEVNYLEAKAFCAWKSEQRQSHIRLLSEAEWYCLRDNIANEIQQAPENPSNSNLDYFCSSSPIDTFSAQGFYDICGNVWHWTESAIDGFTGFEVHPLYDDFSTPTFDGKHNLIKGGSWISTGNEMLKSSRYAFRRHFYQHAGFRYVESEEEKIPQVAVNPFETDVKICQQLAEQYNDTASSQTCYQIKLAHYISQLKNKYAFENNKLLDLGCSAGRTAFELSPHFVEIDAVDFSARIIQYGVRLQQQNSIRYQQVIEGDIVSFHEVSLKTLGLNHSVDNVDFSQGDAVNLKPLLTGYDVIVLQQVLENSYAPKKVLTDIHRRLNDRGLFVVVSDFCFNEQITQKSNWLGGIKVNGENVTGFDGLTQQLLPHFNLLETEQLSQVIPVNSHSSITKNLQVSIWQRHE